jgi:hypothetical protein
MTSDRKVAPDETMVPDARAGVSPRQMVDKKFEAALGAPQAPKNSNPQAGEQLDAARRPARASEN